MGTSFCMSVDTSMLQGLRSRLQIRKSSTAILCTWSQWNKSAAKFSIGPALVTNCYKEPVRIQLHSEDGEPLPSEVSVVEAHSMSPLGLLADLTMSLKEVCFFGRNLISPDSISRCSGVITDSSVRALQLNLELLSSTRVVGGTPEKPWWSSK
jgi:hypothetical protein